MESALGFLSLSPLRSAPNPSLRRNPQNPSFRLAVCCGLRKASRQPLWRGAVMSSEAIQAVQALKLAKSRLAEVVGSRIGRLVKADAVTVLAELRRQNEWEIAVQVFEFVRKDDSFKLDVSVYGDMILMLGKNKLIELAEDLFKKLKKDDLQPDTRAYTEMIGAYLKVGMVDRAMGMYKTMKESGVNPDRLTLTVLIRNLDKLGELDLACAVRKDCEAYVEYPDRFLEELDKSYPKRRPLKLV